MVAIPSVVVIPCVWCQIIVIVCVAVLKMELACSDFDVWNAL